MNGPLKRVAVAVLVMFGLLLLNANYLQVVRAEGLRDNSHNSRVLMREYSHARGPIVVGGNAVAESVATNDSLKYLRRYPGGPLFAHATGFYSLVYGASAIERTENSVLSGEDDRLFVRRLSDLVTGRTPEGGAVLLTLNRAAQEAAAKGLGDRRGAVVALDPRTGAILAMVSSPSYDPGLLTSHNSKQIIANWKRLNAAPGDPLLNRAISQTYPPGSLFKVVTLSAALSSGKFDTDTKIDSPTRLKLPLTNIFLQNFGGESCGGDRITVADALRVSCNTAFANLGMAVGENAMRTQAERFGLGQGFNMPLPVAASHFPDQVDRPQLALSSIGQYDVRLTPLQAAMIAAGIANDGTVMKPYLVDELRAPDTSTLDKTKPERLSEAVSPEVAAKVKQLMELVVQRGTGTAAQIPGVRVGGKTGTAEHATGRPPHAWFIGFAPVEDPQVAVAVVVEDGGNMGSDATGGRLAAPIARSVMCAVLERC